MTAIPGKNIMPDFNRRDALKMSAGFAAAAAAYVRFAVSRGAGFNVIYAAGLQELHDQALADAAFEVVGDTTLLRPFTEIFHIDGEQQI